MMFIVTNPIQERESQGINGVTLLYFAEYPITGSENPQIFYFGNCEIEA